ncbi:hypothetical protein C8Q74DRAFT_322132 [Fomes fomentarius]|nr:hypothetical protein C8Q74DRAFT_322132 [Fomes fomentarius]
MSRQHPTEAWDPVVCSSPPVRRIAGHHFDEFIVIRGITCQVGRGSLEDLGASYDNFRQATGHTYATLWRVTTLPPSPPPQSLCSRSARTLIANAVNNARIRRIRKEYSSFYVAHGVGLPKHLLYSQLFALSLRHVWVFTVGPRARHELKLRMKDQYRSSEAVHPLAGQDVSIYDQTNDQKHDCIHPSASSPLDVSHPICCIASVVAISSLTRSHA